MKILPSLFLFVFGLVWCGAMVALDANNVRSVVLHFRATKFPTTTGTITKSAVKTSGTESRPSYRADIAYSYTVDGVDPAQGVW